MFDTAGGDRICGTHGDAVVVDPADLLYPARYATILYADKRDGKRSQPYKRGRFTNGISLPDSR